MPKLEKSVERKFVVKMESAGWLQLKGDVAKRGFSDRFFFGYEARTVLVEFKREGAVNGRKGEKLQDFYREEFQSRSHECYLIKTEADAEALCEKLCAENLKAKASKESQLKIL